MIRVFTGEFLSAPMPVEIDMATCTHNCLYCYVNVTKPKRKVFRAKSIATAIAKSISGEPKTFLEYFLNKKYCVAMCNRTDPFSMSNYKQTIPTVDLLLRFGIPPAYITKTGRGVDDVLDLHEKYGRKAVWYVTITTKDDKIAKEIERGAPNTTERIKAIQKIVSAGHKVVVAFNPLLDAWLGPDEFYPFTKYLYDEIGVAGFWIAKLHLKPNIIPEDGGYRERLLTKIKERWGHEGFGKPLKDEERQAYVRECVEKLVGNIPVHCANMPYKSNVHDIYESVYGIEHTAPSKVKFINYMIDHNKPRFVTFDDYIKVMKKGYSELFDKEMPHKEVAQYLYIKGFRTVKRFKKSDTATLTDLLAFFWNSSDWTYNINPGAHLFFMYCVDGKDYALDDKGHKLLRFDMRFVNRPVQQVFDLRLNAPVAKKTFLGRR